MIKYVLALSFALFAALPVYAGQPEAREVARINNCTPKKIEVYQNQLGGEGKTIYLVTCTLPKITDKDAPKDAPDSLLISCDESLCELLRPIVPEKK
jgi:hypothetical protein